MLPNDPQVPDPDDPTRLDEKMFKGRAVTYYAQNDYKREVAKQRGAAARITIFEPGMFGVPTWKDRTSCSVWSSLIPESQTRRRPTSARAQKSAPTLHSDCSPHAASIWPR